MKINRICLISIVNNRHRFHFKSWSFNTKQFYLEVLKISQISPYHQLSLRSWELLISFIKHFMFMLDPPLPPIFRIPCFSLQFPVFSLRISPSPPLLDLFLSHFPYFFCHCITLNNSLLPSPSTVIDMKNAQKGIESFSGTMSTYSVSRSRRVIRCELVWSLIEC